MSVQTFSQEETPLCARDLAGMHHGISCDTWHVAPKALGVAKARTRVPLKVVFYYVFPHNLSTFNHFKLGSTWRVLTNVVFPPSNQLIYLELSYFSRGHHLGRTIREIKNPSTALQVILINKP